MPLVGNQSFLASLAVLSGMRRASRILQKALELAHTPLYFPAQLPCGSACHLVNALPASMEFPSISYLRLCHYHISEPHWPSLLSSTATWSLHHLYCQAPNRIYRLSLLLCLFTSIASRWIRHVVGMAQFRRKEAQVLAGRGELERWGTFGADAGLILSVSDLKKKKKLQLLTDDHPLSSSNP